ncbi:hypothetical protein [Methylovulum sp.]|uniref:hypothetical protein n=1 Tax=Methylovulum sp. TaxID=1916980 RepID=UPI0026149C7E|nr:hypothetical protein [Methylovulum sp.]MDD5123590.1 hypothetical protein [Methylovulum sp.]
MKNINDPPSFRLIVHIGAGKTGTTSIQETLRTQQDKLKGQGVWYLGLMLEHAPEIRYCWQRADGFEEFMSLNEEEKIKQFADILESSLKIMSESTFRLAILSNESFLGQNTEVIKSLKILVDSGWDIEIIAYVRRHDAWITSAYEQWALKHKINKGRLLPFSAWVSDGHFHFSKYLRPWMESFNCIVHNVSAIEDAVTDFLTVAGISQEGMEIRRENTALSKEELLLRALFNDQFQEPTDPDVFNRMMGFKELDFGRSATAFLSAYLPTDAELKKHIEDCTADREEVNHLLESAGQPPLDTSPLKSNRKEVDLDKITAAMFTMLVYQAKRIDHLESTIDKLIASRPTQVRTGMKLADKEKISFHIDAYQDGFINGWIVDKSNPFGLAIELHTKQGKIGEGMANEFRSDLVKNISEDGHCAFRIKVDPTIKDFGDQIIILLKDYNECFYVDTSSIQGLIKLD